ncbi:MAG: hypothetical protein GY772_32230, partial [bacterium]|nr:hypothetical protein [bacterium]
MELVSACNDFLRERGGKLGRRAPRGCLTDFWVARTGAPPTKAVVNLLGRLRKSLGSSTCGSVVPALAGSQKRKRSAAGLGLGRPPLAPAMRQDLFRWFCQLRGSVKGRIPLKLLRAQAERCRENYLAACLRSRVSRRAPLITAAWLRSFREECRISLRLPNKRWKVSRRVLEERLRIMWANSMRVRLFIALHHGYAPRALNFDQKPFHMNEAGSKLKHTLDWRGSDRVELKECHASTRTRWTATTCCATDAGPASLPHLECLLKGGAGVLRTLERDVEVLRAGGLLGDSRWLSVAVSSSGSYGTGEILSYLESHLEEWSEGRDWRLLFCDAYAPHAQDAVRSLCWARGYILLLHGGGTTGVAQPPDTHLHSELSREYQDAEMRDLALRMQVDPSALPLRSRGDCVRDLVAIWKSSELHRRGSRGFLANMLTNALDGSEDHLGAGDAAQFWHSLGMGELRSQVLADLREEYRAGRLPWSFRSVRKLEDFPARGQLDFYAEGQEDKGECVDEDRGCAWDDAAHASPDVSDEGEDAA